MLTYLREIKPKSYMEMVLEYQGIDNAKTNPSRPININSIIQAFDNFISSYSAYETLIVQRTGPSVRGKHNTWIFN